MTTQVILGKKTSQEACLEGEHVESILQWRQKRDYQTTTHGYGMKTSPLYTTQEGAKDAWSMADTPWKLNS